METTHERPTTMNALRPAISDINQSDREIRRLRVLLLALMFVEVVSIIMQRVSNQVTSQWWGELRFLPQMLIGFVVLALILTLHLSAQRKLLCEVSTALNAATSYVDRLEQLSVIDPPTQLFNRRYLDELFNHQLKWLNRTGRSATLLLLEVFSNDEKAPAEEIIIEAAFILRSNFRGSDYVVRHFTDQFLVVLPDTNEQEAQVALSRLIDKVDHWNLANEKREMALWLVLNTCPPTGNIWEKLNEIEGRMRDKSDPRVRTLIPLKPVACESSELLAQEHLVQ